MFPKNHSATWPAKRAAHSIEEELTLLTVECLGSCGAAPMMQVDETYYENLTEEKVDRILEDGLSAFGK